MLVQLIGVQWVGRISYDEEYGTFNVPVSLTIKRDKEQETADADFWYGPSSDNTENPSSAWHLSVHANPRLTQDEEYELIESILNHASFQEAKPKLHDYVVSKGLTPITV